MKVCDVYLGLGQEALGELLRSVSIGRLRTFQIFERMKLRLHLNKLNSETLRRSALRVWPRLESGEEELAVELSQAILISHFALIVDVLNFLGVPHEDGFFSKDLKPEQHLTEGWQERVFDEFKSKHNQTALLFYINHLAVELTQPERLFLQPAA